MSADLFLPPPSNRKLSRPEPGVDPRFMQTFQIAAPTHTGRWWRKATCAQVQCDHFLRGWRSVVDESTEEGRGQAMYIRRNSGRGFTETRDEAGMTVFTFHPGQMCFTASQHRVRDFDVPELHIARDGDWRGNPTGRVIRHSGPDPWFDHMATAVDKVLAQRNKG